MMPAVLRYLAALALVTGCGASSPNDETPDAAPAVCMPSAAAPTYSQLYTRYFAPGTPGHCADENCHGQVAFNVWRCGNSKETCFEGMVSAGLIDTGNALNSRLGNSRLSPLRWINNDSGSMPADNFSPFNEGRDAILAWISACAPNN
jgi:hypothetical protein